MNYLSRVAEPPWKPLETLQIKNSSGHIDPAAPHWAIETLVPIDPRELVEYLHSRPESTPEIRAELNAVIAQVQSFVATNAGHWDREFDKLYHQLDPDQDSRRPAGLVESAAANPERVISLCREMLVQAGYREVLRTELEACLGVVSSWGVPLHVDFEQFTVLVVYSRGDVIGTRLFRRMLNFYRPECVEVAVHQRMVVIFQLNKDYSDDETLSGKKLHMRMFKNIPKQDIDMLLPCARVKFTWVDRLKIFVPSIGGVLLSARRIVNAVLIVAVLTLKSTLVIAGLVFVAIGYVVRSIAGYFQTKNRYLLNLTRNLYFQKLNTNAGVGYAIIHQMSEQQLAESILAYYALATANEHLSLRKWQRRCERMIREAVEFEVDFPIQRAATRLQSLGLATCDPALELWSRCANSHDSKETESRQSE